MFRRKQNALPADPVFPPDLEKLGFFVNSEDQVRSIRNPERKFQYHVNRNERWDQVHKGTFVLQGGRVIEQGVIVI